MVVPEISLANTTFSFDLSILSNPQEPFNNMAIDMEVDTPRGWSTSTSTNSSRATSVHSNISSTGYTEHIQALANNLTWADQVEISKSEGPALFYATPKVRETNIANRARTLYHFLFCQSACGPTTVGWQLLPHFLIQNQWIFGREC